MIKYLLIDLDGTILNFKSGERKAFISTIKEYTSYNLTDEDINIFSDLNERLFNEFASGKMKRIEFQIKRFNEIAKIYNIEIDAEKANAYYINKLKYMGDLYEDVADTLTYLSTKYILLIASNGMLEIQNKRLENAQIRNLFQKNYVSEVIGYNKPDSRFFEYIFNDLNDYDPNHYIMIGDRLDTDILGAKSVGIKGILVNRDNMIGKVIPDYEVSSFDQIKNIL